MIPTLRWQTTLWFLAAALALGWMVRSDLAHLNYVSELSMQGSPPPVRDAGSPTGYAFGQRHFLGLHERGETFRWIAAAQDFIAAGPFASPVYHADTVPTGRPQLLPKLYTAWLAAVAWSLHLVTGEPLALSVERAALWEPLIFHVIAFVVAAVWMGRRHGPPAAAATALFFAFFPPLFGQFLPGVLTPGTASLLLAAYAIALTLPGPGTHEKNPAFGIRSAVAASLALWLDPAFGFPAVLLAGVVGAAAILTGETAPRFLRWALIGSATTFVAWLIDQNPFTPAAGELRYVHPLYAVAWLGIGLVLDGARALRASASRRALRSVEVVAGTLLVSALGFVQLTNGYNGWLYPSAWIRRLTSLDRTRAFDTQVDWLASASGPEIVLLFAPTLAGFVLLALTLLRRREQPPASESSRLPAALVLAGLGVLAFFRVRWGVVAALVALPLVWHLATRDFAACRKIAASVAFAFFIGLLAWGTMLPASFQRPAEGAEPSAADIDALVHRHFAHWLATHTPPGSVAALAPPELSDSLVFHGGSRVLMSTAWESYPGQLAATRILSAIESTEAEAVLQAHELTHIILPSWDKVLPLFVQKPALADKNTLYERLNRWVHPPYLRAIPYQLPPMPAFAAAKLAVFKVTPPQDEALSLSRLAEYFLEMEREEPAALAARVLAESYPNDPNAAIARALVYARAAKQSEFEQMVARLAADVSAGRIPADWDRRVQRAIVLALARRHELARREIAACLAAVSEASLFDLTSLPAHRLTTLARGYGVAFPNVTLNQTADALGAEYGRPEN